MRFFKSWKLGYRKLYLQLLMLTTLSGARKREQQRVLLLMLRHPRYLFTSGYVNIKYVDVLTAKAKNDKKYRRAVSRLNQVRQLDRVRNK